MVPTRPSIGELRLPERVLLAPGPSNLPPQVSQALSAPLLGHMDPVFLRVMDETKTLLRYVFQTDNEMTFAIPATGGAGMEAALANMIEPGDRVVVGICGVFGERMAEIASRCGAEVNRVSAEWGRAVEPEAIEAALAKKTKLVALVHGETSTGVEQPLVEIGRLAQSHDALFLVDTVATLGGVAVPVDELGIDICYSGGQKCLSAPPGLAPITFNPRAVEAIKSRKSKVQSWYFDVNLLEQYWTETGARVYHHTAPVPMVYALREACRLVAEEGLEARIARHTRCANALIAGLQAMNLAVFARIPHRLASVTGILVPEDIDDAKVRRALLEDFNIEIGGGLAAYRGKMWRVGMMGYSCTEGNVALFLSALGKILNNLGFQNRGGVEAAMAQCS